MKRKSCVGREVLDKLESTIEVLELKGPQKEDTMLADWGRTRAARRIAHRVKAVEGVELRGREKSAP